MRAFILRIGLLGSIAACSAPVDSNNSTAAAATGESGGDAEARTWICNYRGPDGPTQGAPFPDTETGGFDAVYDAAAACVEANGCTSVSCQFAHDPDQMIAVYMPWAFPGSPQGYATEQCVPKQLPNGVYDLSPRCAGVYVFCAPYAVEPSSPELLTYTAQASFAQARDWITEHGSCDRPVLSLVDVQWHGGSRSDGSH